MRNRFQKEFKVPDNNKVQRVNPMLNQINQHYDEKEMLKRGRDR